MKDQEKYVFIEKLAQDFGLYDLPKGEQKVILHELNDAFEQRAMVRLLDKIKGEKREDFLELLQTNNEHEVFNFLVENVPEVMKELDHVYLDMRKELLSDVKI